MHTIADKKLLMLRPKDIRSPFNRPRKEVDPYELKMLADSIATGGIIQPISVRKDESGRYELIAGERRLQAAVMAGLRRVPCILHRADDETAAFYAVIENLQRSNLGFFEEAQGIDRLITRFGLSQAETAVRLGIAQSTLSNKLRLLRLDTTLRERIISAGLTERHARALLRLPEYERYGALDRIIAVGMTLRETESLISEMLSPKSGEPVKEEKPPALPEEPVRKIVIGDVRLFTNSLSKLVDTLQSSGIKASSHKYETDKYIEYKVRISKDTTESEHFKQLKIC